MHYTGVMSLRLRFYSSKPTVAFVLGLLLLSGFLLPEQAQDIPGAANPGGSGDVGAGPASGGGGRAEGGSGPPSAGTDTTVGRSSARSEASVRGEMIANDIARGGTLEVADQRAQTGYNPDGTVVDRAAIESAYRDYANQNATLMDRVGSFLGGLFGFSEINPLTQGSNPSMVNGTAQADWGWDPVAGILGIAGTGIGFGIGAVVPLGLAYQTVIAQLGGPPLGLVNLGPSAFGSGISFERSSTAAPSVAGSVSGGGARGVASYTTLARIASERLLGQSTLSLSAEPAVVSPGSMSVLRWSASNSLSCDASGGWAGAKAVQGTHVESIEGDTSFKLSCISADGVQRVSKTVFVSVSGVAGDVASGIVRASSCPASYVYAPVCGSDGRTYGNTCNLPATVAVRHSGVCTAAERVSSIGPASSGVSTGAARVASVPTVSLTASPQTIQSGGRVILKWETMNATTCYTSGAWPRRQGQAFAWRVYKPILGSEPVASLTQSTNFTIVCKGEGVATARATVRVTVTPPPPAPAN